MTSSKRSNVTVYRCDCGNSIISKVQLAEVWCLPCGRLMHPVRPTSGTHRTRDHVQHDAPDQPADR